MAHQKPLGELGMRTADTPPICRQTNQDLFKRIKRVTGKLTGAHYQPHSLAHGPSVQPARRDSEAISTLLTDGPLLWVASPSARFPLEHTVGRSPIRPAGLGSRH